MKIDMKVVNIQDIDEKLLNSEREKYVMKLRDSENLHQMQIKSISNFNDFNPGQLIEVNLTKSSMKNVDFDAKEARVKEAAKKKKSEAKSLEKERKAREDIKKEKEEEAKNAEQ